ncbi:hypothetical protein ACLMJK_009527 [Lecanora helva]
MPSSLLSALRAAQLLFFLSFICIPSPTHGSCSCGYLLNTTPSQQQQQQQQTLYTHALETDFLHLPSYTTTTPPPLNGSAWSPQSYLVPAEQARGPWGKNASVGNVVLKPLGEGKWDAEGGEAGLEIWVRKVEEGRGYVGMGEVATGRRDMLFGTFRVGMRMSGVGGTCGAFFWYYNDTQEIDLEFLSHQNTPTTHPLNLVLQSPSSASAGFNAANTSTFQLHSLPFDPATDFHEYRFDWSPSSVSFYGDGVLLDTMTEAVPNSPGHLTLSHWSNGDPGWSGGPPDVDAVMRVEYVKAYFNSSDEELMKEWEKGCKDPQAVNATCVIPDSPSGNASGKTVFLSQQDGTGGKSGGKKSEAVEMVALSLDTVFFHRVAFLFAFWILL